MGNYVVRRIGDRGRVGGHTPVLKTVDDFDNMIFDPSQNKLVPGHKIITIDAFTGKELTERDLESPMDTVHRNAQEAYQRAINDAADEISMVKARGDWPNQPWLDGIHKPKGERKVLSEFVGGKTPPAPVTPSQPTPSVLTAVPDGQITIDIPGSLYADLADQEIQNMKSMGHKHAFVDVEMPPKSTAFAEFKAIMRSKGCEVNTSEMSYRGGGCTYKVMITW